MEFIKLSLEHIEIRTTGRDRPARLPHGADQQIVDATVYVGEIEVASALLQPVRLQALEHSYLDGLRPIQLKGVTAHWGEKHQQRTIDRHCAN